MVNIKRDGETKLGRQILLDIDPVITAVRAFINATVVLLIQNIWLCRMLHQPMNALTEFRVRVWQETGAGILIGKNPCLATIICSHTTYGGDANPHSGCI